jgi:hypothetical protein
MGKAAKDSRLMEASASNFRIGASSLPKELMPVAGS